MTAKVFSVNISKNKGEPKNMVKSALLKEGHGFDGDAHAGENSRQVSLLAVEEIERAILISDTGVILPGDIILSD